MCKFCSGKYHATCAEELECGVINQKATGATSVICSKCLEKAVYKDSSLEIDSSVLEEALNSAMTGVEKSSKHYNPDSINKYIDIKLTAVVAGSMKKFVKKQEELNKILVSDLKKTFENKINKLNADVVNVGKGLNDQDNYYWEEK